LFIFERPDAAREIQLDARSAPKRPNTT